MFWSEGREQPLQRPGGKKRQPGAIEDLKEGQTAGGPGRRGRGMGVGGRGKGVGIAGWAFLCQLEGVCGQGFAKRS